MLVAPTYADTRYTHSTGPIVAPTDSPHSHTPRASAPTDLSFADGDRRTSSPFQRGTSESEEVGMALSAHVAERSLRTLSICSFIASIPFLSGTGITA